MFQSLMRCGFRVQVLIAVGLGCFRCVVGSFSTLEFGVNEDFENQSQKSGIYFISYIFSGSRVAEAFSG